MNPLEVTLDRPVLKVTSMPCVAERKELSSGIVTFKGQTLIEGMNSLLQANTHIKPANQIQMKLMFKVHLDNYSRFTDQINWPIRINVPLNLNIITLFHYDYF